VTAVAAAFHQLVGPSNRSSRYFVSVIIGHADQVSSCDSSLAMTMTLAFASSREGKFYPTSSFNIRVPSPKWKK
jgi:hypothetical protein